MPTIEKRNGKNVSYKLVAFLGYQQDGKQIRKQKTYKPNPNWSEKKAEAEAMKQAVIFEQECINGLATTSRIKFYQYANDWIEQYAKTQLKPKTYTDYESKLKVACEYLGHIQLIKLTQYDLNALYNYLTNKGLSGVSVGIYHRIIRSMLNFSVNEGLIPHNPALKATPPKATPIKDHLGIDELDMQTIIKELPTLPIEYRTPITIAYTTGMRIGEIMGLSWDCINFDDNSIFIKRTLAYITDKGLTYDTPKTRTSIRVIPVPISTMEEINKYKQWVEDNKLFFGEDYIKSEYFFVHANGTPIHNETLNKQFGKLLTKNKIKHYSFHDLRHYFATNLIHDSKIPLQAIASQLGHASATTTLNYYSHAISLCRPDERMSIALNEHFN